MKNYDYGEGADVMNNNTPNLTSVKGISRFLKTVLLSLAAMFIMAGITMGSGVEAKAASAITQTYGTVKYKLSADRKQLFIEDGSTGTITDAWKAMDSSALSTIEWVKINSLNVTAIGDNAFSNLTNCKYITSRKSKLVLSSIGSYAFANCPKLERVTIPFHNSSAITIKDHAFYNDAKLEKFGGWSELASDGTSETFHYSDTSSSTNPFRDGDVRNCVEIGKYAFYGCTSLSRLRLDTYYKTDNLAGTTISRTASQGLKIGNYAFASSGLTAVAYRDSIVTYGSNPDTVYGYRSTTDSYVFPFFKDAEYLSGYIVRYPDEISLVKSGTVYATNTFGGIDGGNNNYADVTNGAVIDGKKCDYRLYAKSSSGHGQITMDYRCSTGHHEVGCGNLAGGSTIKLEYHFYPSGTLKEYSHAASIPSSKEISFKGLYTITDNDETEGIAIIGGSKRNAYTYHNATMKKNSDGSWRGTNENMFNEQYKNNPSKVDTFFSRAANNTDDGALLLKQSTIWIEVSSTPSNPLIVEYHDGQYDSMYHSAIMGDEVDGNAAITIKYMVKQAGSSTWTESTRYTEPAGIRWFPNTHMVAGSGQFHGWYKNQACTQDAPNDELLNSDTTYWGYFEATPINTYQIDCYDYDIDSGAYLGRPTPGYCILDEGATADVVALFSKSHSYTDYTFVTTDPTNAFIVNSNRTVKRYFRKTTPSTVRITCYDYDYDTGSYLGQPNPSYKDVTQGSSQSVSSLFGTSHSYANYNWVSNDPSGTFTANSNTTVKRYFRKQQYHYYLRFKNPNGYSATMPSNIDFGTDTTTIKKDISSSADISDYTSGNYKYVYAGWVGNDSYGNLTTKGIRYSGNYNSDGYTIVQTSSWCLDDYKTKVGGIYTPPDSSGNIYLDVNLIMIRKNNTYSAKCYEVAGSTSGTVLGGPHTKGDIPNGTAVYANNTDYFGPIPDFSSQGYKYPPTYTSATINGSDVTVYRIYELKTYTVTCIDIDIDTGETLRTAGSVTKTHGFTMSVEGTWGTSAPSGYEYVEPDPTGTFTVTQDKTVYRKFRAIKLAKYEVTRGSGGNGVHLNAKINNVTYNIFKLKGGNGAAPAFGSVEPACSIDSSLKDRFASLMSAASGGGSNDIFKGEQTVGGRVIVKFMEKYSVTAPANNGTAAVNVPELLPAVRFNFNNGSVIDMGDDIVFMSGTETKSLPSSRISINGKIFRGWSTEHDGTYTATENGKTVYKDTRGKEVNAPIGTYFAAGQDVKGSDISSAATAQGENILTLYAIWERTSTTFNP